PLSGAGYSDNSGAGWTRPACCPQTRVAPNAAARRSHSRRVILINEVPGKACGSSPSLCLDSGLLGLGFGSELLDNAFFAIAIGRPLEAEISNGEGDVRFREAGGL